LASKIIEAKIDGYYTLRIRAATFIGIIDLERPHTSSPYHWISPKTHEWGHPICHHHTLESVSLWGPGGGQLTDKHNSLSLWLITRYENMI